MRKDMPKYAESVGDAAPSHPRFAQERQHLIAQTLRELGRVEVPALAVQYAVSEDTIRRDLRALAARGLVQKTHGGAVVVHPTVMPNLARGEILARCKENIAQAALAHVSAHQTLFIDAGSTTMALVRLLCQAPDLRPLSVITTALDVAYALADQAGISLVLAGGEWLPEQRIFQGEQALAALRAHRADIAFLGACALHPRMGITSQDSSDAAAKRAMIASAARRIVLADASKLDMVAPHAVCALAEADLVISDAAPAWLAEQTAVEQV